MVKVAVVGATGLVGEAMLARLAESPLAFEEVALFASARSAGETRLFRGKTLPVQALDEHSFASGFDYALFSAGSAVSKAYAPLAEEAGAIAIDNSSAWRMEEGIDLIVPECNGRRSLRGIIANPNCSTIQAVVALKPLSDAFGIKRVSYVTFQSVSGSGGKGLADLRSGREGVPPRNYPHPIYNNVLPQIDEFVEDGYTKEEVKMIEETKKILALPSETTITATCVRVPVESCHAVEINVSLAKETSPEAIRSLLERAPGVVVHDSPGDLLYPMPVSAVGTDSVYVGRIRRDRSLPNAFHLFCVADNIRKGAASNAVQIVEMLEREK